MQAVTNGTGVGTGAIIAGRYRLVERIATGGMGSVWRATDEVLGRAVAVKLMSSEYADDPVFRDRFKAEARHTAALSHPNIVNVFDYGEAPSANGGDGVAYLVMEYVEATPLSQLLADRGRLPVAQTLQLLAQGAAALAAAHAGGLVHRDVKPANLLVRGDGTTKLTDFGIAWAASVVPLTSTGIVLGSADYLSPEQALGRTVTAASDIYSLGLVGYECLTGRRPFRGDGPVAVAMARLHQAPEPLPMDVPAPVRGLIEHCLALDPADRPGSAAELAAAAGLLHDQLNVATPTVALPEAATTVLPAAEAMPVSGSAATVRLPSPLPPTGRLPAPPAAAPHSRRHRRWILVGLAALALLVVALLWPTRTSVAVPSVDGEQLSAAQANLGHLHLRSVVHRVDAPGHVAGAVLAQNPVPGTRVRPGTTVILTTASGLVDVNAASYVGQPADQVAAALRALGLQVAVTQTGVGGPVGSVTGLTPAGQLPQGSTVTLAVVPVPPVPAPGPGGKHKTAKGHG